MAWNWKSRLEAETGRYRVPRHVQDLIPIDTVYPDGIFRKGRVYSASFLFSDMNFRVASEEEKKVLLEKFGMILNSLDSNADTKFTIFNHPLKREELGNGILLPCMDDGNDPYREEINDLITGSACKEEGIYQRKYLTVSIPKRDITEARVYFSRITPELTSLFSAMGSRLTRLDGYARLKILHDYYDPKEESFSFSFEKASREGMSFRDCICPDGAEKHADYLVLGEKYVRTLFIRSFASFIRDDFVDELTAVCPDLVFSVDVEPVPTEEAVRDVERRLLGIDTNITNWQRRQNRNNNFSAVIPYDLDLQRKETKAFLEEITTRDQKMLMATMTIAMGAGSLEELDRKTEALEALAVNRMCRISVLRYQQLDGLNTALPLGPKRIYPVRTMTTSSLSVFQPFQVQDIREPGGTYFGINAISGNLILCNKEGLMNQSAFLLGVPGSGKSLLTKFQIAMLLLKTRDDILICDPEGEYGNLVRQLDPDASILTIAAGGKTRLNAMLITEGYGEEDAVAVKSQFVLSLVEQIDKDGVGPQHKSIIDRCVRNLYESCRKTGEVPTLSKLRQELLRQPEKQGKEVALSLELYTDGSLNIFGGESNVKQKGRTTVFDIHSLGSQLKAAGLLVITDTMLNRVTENWKQGKRTHIFLDEFHVVFENDYSAEFFASAWRQFRKRNAYPTAITQNVEYLLDSVQASTMLSNSECIVMLNQAASDREKLGELLHISQEQIGYVTNAPAGCGLLRYGGYLIPFENRIPKKTKLYSLMTTKPGEGVFGESRGSDGHSEADSGI